MRPWAAGIGASAALLAFYAVVMGFASSFSVMLAQLRSLWYLMLPLIAGFGVQVGLFVRMRERASPAGVAASGGGSGAAMLACCAHHLTDIAPLLGLTAATLFLAKYQTALLVLGILSNIVGIALMARMLGRTEAIPHES